MFQAHALHALWIFAAIVAYRTLITHKICQSDSSKMALGLATTSIALAGAVDWLSVLPDYSRWFLPGVYPVFDWAIIALIALGSFFFIRAIELRRENGAVDETAPTFPGEEGGIVSSAQGARLLAAEELRRLLAQPYPFVELAASALERILREIRAEDSGAIYVFNDATGRMTLISARELETDEEAAIEELAMREPLLSEAFAAGSPTLTRKFLQQEAPDSVVRRHALALPIIHQEKPLGCVIALSREPIELTVERKRLIGTLAEIVGEKFHLVKLGGELRKARRKVELARSGGDAWLELVATLAAEEWTESALRDDCVRLCNQAGSDNCALLSGGGSAEGVSILVAESAENGSISEIDGAVLSACRQALNSGAAALLTRRNGAEQRNIGVIVPFTSRVAEQQRSALLLWNDVREFRVTGSEWRGIQAVAGALSLRFATRTAPDRNDTNRLLERALSLLAADTGQRTSSEELSLFLEEVSSAVENLSAALLYARDDRGRLRPVSAAGTPLEELAEVVILPGEGALGRAAAIGVESVSQGRERLDNLCSEYDMMNRDIFGERFSALGEPEAEIILPIPVNSRNDYVVAIYLRDATTLEKVAHELKILCSIESLKLSALELKAERFAPAMIVGDPETARRLGMTYNNINNDLSAIVGNCQLIGADQNLPGGVERALRVIQERAESAAERLRAESAATLKVASRSSSPTSEGESYTSAGVSLTDAIRRFADDALVGGDILLTDNKARELSLDLAEDVRVKLSESVAGQLAEELCRRFTALAEERERVTVSAYRNAQYHCLDLSRHRREFPPLCGAVEFARYQAPVDQFFGLPASLCESLRAAGVEFAVDETDEVPAFVSMRAPLLSAESVKEGARPSSTSAPRILAIDDQSMILDLLQAMCQSMGYEVVVNSSPREALEEFRRNRFEIVISDIAMPEMNGWEVAKKIRELDADTRIIFVTGWGESVTPEALSAAGVDRIVYKPFRIEQLAEALESIRSDSLSL